MHQIRYVLAAAETLNFTRAAGNCSVSQPALTKGVKALETELGAQLFHREGKRVLLSEFGRSMLPHLRRIADEAEAAKSLARNFQMLQEVPVRLGAMSTIGHVRFARFLQEFGRTHSGVGLEITEASVAELRKGLGEDAIDIAILTDEPSRDEGFALTPLYAERFVVIFPPEHRLAELDSVRLKDLSGEPYIDRLSCEMRERIFRECEREGVELYARFRSEREDWVQAMVLAGLGFAFVPEYSVTLPGLLQRPLSEPALSRQVSLATAPGRPHTPAVAAFLQMARSFAWPG